MSEQFSRQLQERLIRYFEKKYGFAVSAASSDDYLDSWGELFIEFESLQAPHAGGRGSGRGGGACNT